MLQSSTQYLFWRHTSRDLSGEFHEVFLESVIFKVYIIK